MWLVFDTALVAAGYVGSIYSWSTVRLWAVGAAAEATALRKRATDLEAQIRRL